MAKPFKVICISMYAQDLNALDQLVERLKNRGHKTANRSRLIRMALKKLDEEEAAKALAERPLDAPSG